MWEEAIVSFNKYMNLSYNSPLSLCALGYAYGRSERREAALQFIEKLEKLSEERYVSPFINAVIYLGIGNKNQAFTYLEKGFVDREPSLVLLGVQPFFDSIRNDPLYHTLLMKIGLPPD
jgi:tetratricopeptide (TPR) repeat protein